MMKTNLKEIEKVAMEFGNNVDLVAKEIKRLQSAKCRLKKFKGRSDYDYKMDEILRKEEVLKEVKNLLEPKEKPVTMYEQEDVDMLDYDEAIKARRSIQSKKCLTRWLTEKDGDNDEYRKACKIEEMLNEHISKLKPVDDDKYIRRTDLQTIIDTIEESGNLSQERILELLKSL